MQVKRVRDWDDDGEWVDIPPPQGMSIWAWLDRMVGPGYFAVAYKMAPRLHIARPVCYG